MMNSRSFGVGILFILTITTTIRVLESVRSTTRTLSESAGILGDGIDTTKLPYTKSNEITAASISMVVGRKPAVTVRNNTSHRGDRPTLILHIGPHKTASSLIQCHLTYSRDALFRSKNASFIYLGRTYGNCLKESDHMYDLDTRSMIQCLNHNEERQCSEQTTWKQLERILKKLAKGNHNIIVSDEAFSRMHANQDSMELLRTTLSKRFNVMVVITYRRYFEWLLSIYNENYKRRLWQPWPQEGGKPIRPFPRFYKKPFSGYQRAAERAEVHPGEYLRRLWGRYFDDVRIFNMHQDGDLISNFVTQVVPEAKEALEKADRQDKRGQTPSRPNLSMLSSFDFDMLAEKAREMGLVRADKYLSREVVSVTIESKLGNSSSYKNAPRVCLSDSELEEFLKKSLRYEQRMFPDQSNTTMMIDHTKSFREAVTQRKFCNLATEEYIKDDFVLSIFQWLNKVSST